MSLRTELRHASRRLVRAPAFTLVAVATVAIGIGANAAVFGLVDAVLLRSLPYPESERLVMAWQDYTERGGPATEWFSPANYLDWRAEIDALDGLGAFTGWGPTLIAGQGDPVALAGGAVSHDFLTVLGAQLAHGRMFRPDEEAEGAAEVVILGHRVWRERFGADPAIVGQTVLLGGLSREVVGVLERGFEFPLLPGTDAFTPLTLDPATAPRGSIYLRAVGRLAPGASLERVQSEARVLAARIAEEYPRSNRGVGANIEPLRDVLVGDVRLGLLVLFAGVGAVLLIACVNLANLLLARATTRYRESAVRAALGAGRVQLARLPLIESGLLALAGAGIGVVLAAWLMDLLVALSPMGLPAMFEPTLNAGVLAFTALLAVITALGFGVVPALKAARGELVGGLREGGRGGSARARGRKALVVAQVAFALTLLIAAGLLTRSFLRLQSVDPGFRADDVLILNLTTPSASYPEGEQVAGFFERLMTRLEAIPGVESAGAVSNAPFSGGDTDVTFVIEGQPAAEPGEEKVIWYRQVTPGYLTTMEIPVLRGRGLTEADQTGAPVVVLGEAAAVRFFPGVDPVGRRLKPGSDPDSDEPWWTVVGVVGAVRHNGLDAAPKLEMYLPHGQSPRRNMAVTVRSTRDAASLAPAVRSAVRELDPTLAVANLTTMEQLISGSVAMPRFLTLAIGAFGLLALLLAVIGVYGVISQLVGQRTRELGIRISLGATPGAVKAMVLRQGAVLVAAGAALGLLGALLVSRLIGGLLFEVPAVDPVSYIGLPVLLTAVALLAIYLPARRAAAVDPVTALREE